MARNSTVGNAVGWAILLSGIAGVAMWQHSVHRHDASDWQTADAVVVEATSEFVSKYKGGSGFEPRVRYRYEVNKAEYDGDVFSRPQARLFPKDEIDGVMRTYAVGNTVTIHYKRTDPATATIEFRSWLSPHVLSVIAIVTTCVTGIAWIVVIRTIITKRS